MKSRNSDPITIDVKFPTQLDRNQIGNVVTDLLQTLLHQRNQIPLQYDVLIKDVRQSKEVDCNPASDDLTSTPTGRRSREDVKNEREVKRKEKTRQRYLSSAAKFVDSCEETVELVKNVIRDEESVAAVTFLLGATRLHPRESYTVKLPPTSSILNATRPPNGVGVHLFRAMVTNDRLFSLTSTRLSVSNLFIVFHMSESIKTTFSMFEPLDRLPLLPSCTRIDFNLEVTPDIRPVAARLRFDSGSTESRNGSSDSPMVMSTPGPSTSPPSYRIFKSKNETVSPSKRSYSPDHTKSSRKVLTMDLCTPAGARGGSEDMILCTPLTTPRMVLCTPAPSTLDLGTTPGLRRLNTRSNKVLREMGNTPGFKRLDTGSNMVLKEEVVLEHEMQKASLSSQDSENLLSEEKVKYYIISNPLRGFKY